MSKSVVKTETNVPQLHSAPSRGYSNFEADDIIIPRLLVGQGMSELVTQRKVAQGDFYKNSTGEVIGNPEKPVEIIPLDCFKKWVILREQNKKFVFARVEDYTPETVAKYKGKFEPFKEGADTIKAVESLGVYALVAADLVREREELAAAKKEGRMPSLNAAVRPVLITFQSTSRKGGKAITDQFAQAKDYGVPGYVRSLYLGCTTRTNEKGTFWVLTTKSGRDVSKEDLPIVAKWFDRVTQGAVKTDDTGIDSDMGDESASTITDY
jgi:hypothetical protein